MNIDFSQISNIWQLVAFVVCTFLVTSLPIIIKNSKLIKDKEKIKSTHKKEIENIKDSQQDNRLNQIETKLDSVIIIQNSMNMILKDSEFLKKIDITTNSILNDFTAIKELNNKRLSYCLSKGQEKFSLFVRRILYENFEISGKEVKKSYYNFLKSIKEKLVENKAKLNLKNPDIYINNLQNYLINRIDLFILNFCNYKEKNNGERREEFRAELLNLFSDIVQNSIELYQRAS